jgi:hypothetical protein
MAGTIVGANFINPDIFARKLAKAFEAWARFDVNDYFRDQFTTPKWDYDGETRRKNGDYITSPKRDIYDLGSLYRSGRDSFKIESNGIDVTASWSWDAENSSGRAYAWYVHEGLSTNRNARQWTDVFQEQNLFISSNIRKSLRDRIRTAFL